jgi:hypothetical protein
MKKDAKSKDSPIWRGGEMWALTNYGAVRDISYFRRDCVAAGSVLCGTSEKFADYLKRGIYDIRKVKVSARK